MKLHRSSVLGFVTLASVGLGLYACSGDDTVAPPGTDAGVDAVADVAKDAPKDSPADAPKDGNVQDTGTDAGLNPTSAQIQAVRNAAVPVVVDAGLDGGDASTDAATDAAVDAAPADAASTPVNLPIDNAIVTYVRTAAVGADPAGFFLQAEKTGPAIFVAIDPGTLSPVPVPGDTVSMVVTAVTNVASLREIVAVTGWTRSAQGTPLAPLLQDLTAATDLVTALDSYESEYLKVSGKVATDFAGASAGFTSAQITTTGLTVASANFTMRLPATVQTSVDLAKGCTFALTGIMWRYKTSAEPSGWADVDLSALVCNAPKVASAASTALTTVIVSFDRKIDTNSLLANGSQFTMNNGLTVSAAVLSGPNQVTLTTSSQTPGASYTVTVANTLKDTLGKGIDVTANTANFLGFLVPAVVRLNELNPNITGSFDLIELRVITAGNIQGITIEENLVNNKVTLATLPALQVAANDLVVVHITPAVDGGVPITSETTTKGDCVDSTCYPNAWDVRGGTTGMTYSGRVIVARTANAGTLQDGISWFRTGSAPSASWYLETNALAAALQWVDCNGVACADNTGATAISVDSNGCGATAAGASVRRVSNTDTNAKADWAVGASTFGAANP